MARGAARRFRSRDRDDRSWSSETGVGVRRGSRLGGRDRFGGPVEAVNWRKQKELGRSARVWVSRHGRSHDAYRFDVVGVLVEGQRVRIRHVEDAFPLHLSA